jgi:hypothetical protein
VKRALGRIADLHEHMARGRLNAEDAELGGRLSVLATGGKSQGDK